VATGEMRVLLKAKSLEGQVQLDTNEYYRLLESPVIKEMSLRVQLLIKEIPLTQLH